MKLRICLIVFACFICICASGNLYSQTAINTPVADKVYDAVDILIAHDLAGHVIIGQRPYSRLEIARILRNANEEYRKRYFNIETGDLSEEEKSRELKKLQYVGELLDTYIREYHDEVYGDRPNIEIEPLKKIRLTYLYNSSKPEMFLNGRGTGRISGLITSFDHYDYGITYSEGMNIFLNSEHNIRLSQYFAMSLQPQFEFQQPSDGYGGAYAHILRLYAKTGWKNIELEVGRDSLLWGQSEFGGMLFTSNARPIDMMKIGNPYPWRIKYIGSLKFTFFVSNMGPDRDIPWSYLYGLKFSWRLGKIFEFGLGETITIGGDGAPKLSFWDPLIEMFPFNKAGNNLSFTDKSDHRFGIFDFRLTIPPLRYSIIYWDSMFDDSPLRAIDNIDNIWNQMSFTAGVYIPRLTPSGDMSLRLEFQRVAPLGYRHSRWSSGYTLNRRLIGSPLGPDAFGIYGTYKWWPSVDCSGWLRLAFENRSSDTYRTEINSQGGGDRILKNVNGPDERRYRIMAGGEFYVRPNISIMPMVGYEYITNVAFNNGRNVNNGIIGVSAKMFFDQFNFKK